MKMDTKASHKAAFIGRASVTPLPSLPGGLGRPGRLLAIGNMGTAPCPSPSMDQLDEARTEVPLASLDYLVAGTSCDLHRLLATVAQLKAANPSLRVILADSEEAPALAGKIPAGVEAVLAVSGARAEAGRALLFQQGGILAGANAGLAAYAAFIMEAKIETGATIGLALTNLSPELLGIL